MTVKEYESKVYVPESKRAEATVSGILRGGWVVFDKFYYTGLVCTCVDLSECTNLRYLQA